MNKPQRIIGLMAILCVILCQAVAYGYNGDYKAFLEWVEKTNGVTDNFLPPDRLKEGAKAQCLTVLKGTERTASELIYVGKISHPLASQTDLYLFKIGQPLKDGAAVAGMSGSPVYLYDEGQWKLIGAYAYGLNNFTNGEYLAGVTPIQAMLSHTALSGQEAETNQTRKILTPAGLDINFIKSITSNMVFNLKNQKIITEILNGRITPTLIGDYKLKPLLQWQVLEQAKAKIANQDQSKEAIPYPGDAVSVTLVEGNLTARATGTVTYVDKNKKIFVAFGHPFLRELGQFKKPAYRTEIITTSLSQSDSYKLPGECLEHFGTIEQDNLFGITGSIGPAKEQILWPVTLHLEIDGQKTDYYFAIIRHSVLSPALIYVIADRLIDDIWLPAADNSYRYLAQTETKVFFTNHQPFVFCGNGLMAPINIKLMNNTPFESWEKWQWNNVLMMRLLMVNSFDLQIDRLELTVKLKSNIRSIALESIVFLDKNQKPIEAAVTGEPLKILLSIRDTANNQKYVLAIPYTPPAETQGIYIQLTSGLYFMNYLVDFLDPQDERHIIIDGLEDGDATQLNTADDWLNSIKKRFTNNSDLNKLYVRIIRIPVYTEIPYNQRKAVKNFTNGAWQAVDLKEIREAKTKKSKDIFKDEYPNPPSLGENYILEIDISTIISIFSAVDEE